MTVGRTTPAAAEPRAAALAAYLRRTAASFAMSADEANNDRTAEAGMALLDAAQLAESIPRGDARLLALSEAGLFESLPHGGPVFVETPEIRRSVRRPLAGTHEDGATIIARLVVAAGLDLSVIGEAMRRASPGSPPVLVPLHVLSETVRTARLGMRNQRLRVTPAELNRARRELVVALETYVIALELWSFPVPHLLRMELHLHKGLLDGS